MDRAPGPAATNRAGPAGASGKATVPPPVGGRRYWRRGRLLTRPRAASNPGEQAFELLGVDHRGRYFARLVQKPPLKRKPWKPKPPPFSRFLGSGHARSRPRPGAGDLSGLPGLSCLPAARRSTASPRRPNRCRLPPWSDLPALARGRSYLPPPGGPPILPRALLQAPGRGSGSGSATWPPLSTANGRATSAASSKPNCNPHAVVAADGNPRGPHHRLHEPLQGEGRNGKAVHPVYGVPDDLVAVDLGELCPPPKSNT